MRSNVLAVISQFRHHAVALVVSCFASVLHLSCSQCVSRTLSASFLSFTLSLRLNAGWALPFSPLTERLPLLLFFPSLCLLLSRPSAFCCRHSRHPPSSVQWIGINYLLRPTYIITHGLFVGTNVLWIIFQVDALKADSGACWCGNSLKRAGYGISILVTRSGRPVIL